MSRFLRQAWRRWRVLRHPERVFVLQGLALLPLARFALACCGLGRCMDRLGRIAVEPAQARMSAADAVALAQALDAAARNGPLASTCLVRALVTAWLLRRRGVDVVVRLGVKLEGSVLQAHAWPEWQGFALADRTNPQEEFAVLTTRG